MSSILGSLCILSHQRCSLQLQHNLIFLDGGFQPRGGGGGGGGTRPENWWGCAAGRWKLDPKRSRKKLNLRPKRSIFVKIGSFCTPKDSFAVGGWEKVPQKDRARSCQSEKRGSKPGHICITHHIGSTPPGISTKWTISTSNFDMKATFTGAVHSEWNQSLHETKSLTTRVLKSLKGA